MREQEGTGRSYYTVSEAVERCGVPSHVLRYWEDELGLSIERTAQGHRVYSEENLAAFAKVKELKEKGIQLKAIRLLLEDSEEGHRLGKLLGEEMGEAVPGESRQIRKPEGVGQEQAETSDVSASEQETMVWEEETNRPENVNPGEEDYEILPAAEADSYRRFAAMLRDLIGEVVAEQNERLEHTLSERLHEEMEDLYVQLQQEEVRREAAAAKEWRPYAVRKEGILERIRRILRG